MTVGSGSRSLISCAQFFAGLKMASAESMDNSGFGFSFAGDLVAFWKKEEQPHNIIKKIIHGINFLEKTGFIEILPHGDFKQIRWIYKFSDPKFIFIYAPMPKVNVRFLSL